MVPISVFLLQKCSPKTKYNVSLLTDFLFTNKEKSITEWEAYWQLGFFTTQRIEKLLITIRHNQDVSIMRALLTFWRPLLPCTNGLENAPSLIFEIFTLFFSHTHRLQKLSLTYFKNSSSFWGNRKALSNIKLCLSSKVWIKQCLLFNKPYAYTRKFQYKIATPPQHFNFAYLTSQRLTALASLIYRFLPVLLNTVLSFLSLHSTA